MQQYNCFYIFQKKRNMAQDNSSAVLLKYKVSVFLIKAVYHESQQC